ncbi:MAG TPA: hypothetical protein VJT32_16430 [bacterium]|nr:hypothetical protein [bacterium]
MMRRGVLAFWIGVVVTYIVLTLNASSTTFDVDMVPGETPGVGVAERIDQGPLSRLVHPELGTLGTVRFSKRGWGFLTTYSQELTVTAARLAQQAGSPLSVAVSLEVPGKVTGTNASGRDGGALVWSGIPKDGPLWVRTRAINWPVVLFAAVAIALSLWVRGGDPSRSRDHRAGPRTV